MIQDLAMVADFQSSLSLPLEEFLFQQEFFSTGLCLQPASGQDQGLKMFARENLQYEEHGEISQSSHESIIDRLYRDQLCSW